MVVVVGLLLHLSSIELIIYFVGSSTFNIYNEGGVKRIYMVSTYVLCMHTMQLSNEQKTCLIRIGVKQALNHHGAFHSQVP
jgi:hypothetical protein